MAVASSAAAAAAPSLVDCDVTNYALVRSFLASIVRFSVRPSGRSGVAVVVVWSAAARQERQQHFLLPKLKKIGVFLRGRPE